MKPFFINSLKKFVLIALAICLFIAGSFWQHKALGVKAEVQVLVVNPTIIAFGTVFPGEEESETYSVSLTAQASGAIYQTTTETVPGKLNLCELMTLVPIDVPAEGDSMANSILTKFTDPSDLWRVSFTAPALEGYVAQDHEGKIVVLAGDYACKIIITTQTRLEKDNRRMTGGGSFFPIKNVDNLSSDTRITHGFELHCDPTNLPNRLEINWEGKGKKKDAENNFHLLNLTHAQCIDDSNIDEEQPNAGFDTYEGVGTGRFNGVNGYTAHWVFTDAGEPGKKDAVFIVIKAPNGTEVLRVGGNWDTAVNSLLTPAQLETLVTATSGAKITQGNQQAHK
jgi:hypothetical protein